MALKGLFRISLPGWSQKKNSVAYLPIKAMVLSGHNIPYICAQPGNSLSCWTCGLCDQGMLSQICRGRRPNDSSAFNSIQFISASPIYFYVCKIAKRNVILDTMHKSNHFNYLYCTSSWERRPVCMQMQWNKISLIRFFMMLPEFGSWFRKTIGQRTQGAMVGLFCVVHKKVIEQRTVRIIEGFVSQERE